MKKTFLFVAMALFMALVIAGCGSPPENTVAKVGKFNITLDELDEAAAPMMPRWQTYEDAVEGKMGVLENLVQQKLILMAAYREGMDKDSLLVERVTANDERRLITALWEVEIAAKVEVSDQMIEDLYEKRRTEFHAAHILVSDEALANELASKARAGEDFAQLAQEHSLDPGSGAQGGDLGWFTAGRMVKPFEDAVFELADGQISDPVQTQYGFHVIKRLGTRSRSQEPLENMRENLRSTLERELQGTKALEFVENMFDQRGFKLDEKAVELVVEKFQTAAANTDAPPEVVFTVEEIGMTISQWDDGAWTIAELDSAIKMRPAYQRQPLMSAMDVENFIKGNLQGDFLVKEAERLNITKSDKFKELYDKELEELMVSTYQNQHIYGNIEVGEEQIRQYYEANLDSFMEPKTVVVVEVQVDGEAEANDIAAKVRAGENIANFVEQKSLRTYTKAAGGQLEITERRFPNLWTAVSNAGVGDIVGPTQDRTNRWSVMKVTEVRQPKAMPFESVSGRIQSMLRRDLRETALEDFIANARKEFSVKIYESVVKSSIDPAAYQQEQPIASTQ
ncbi:MAG TPA: peptidyl-prolyl cis-trans isomerase [candidate division Zixibacteria bacterium]|nr:peptidyl-prolyl cis-trans isomerase [candidate division Zixibacteria bacterium]